MLPLPSVTTVSAVGYMQEKPEHPVGTRSEWISNNPIGVWLTRATPENPQETRCPSGILRDHTPTISDKLGDDEMVRALWRRREGGRNDRSASRSRLVVTDSAKFLVR